MRNRDNDKAMEKLAETLESRTFWYTFTLVSLVGFFLEKTTSSAGVLLLAQSSILALKALLELREKKLGVDALMSIVGYATYFLGARVEGFIIYVLYGIAESLEEVAESWAQRSLRQLLEVVPRKVLARRGSEWTEVGIEDLNVGDYVRVRPGERVPADAVVLDNEGMVDLSIITGESEPQMVTRGDTVPSGALVLSKPLTLRVVKDPRESTAQLIIQQVREALERKGRVEGFLNRVSAPYTLVVLGAFSLAALVLDPYRGLSIILAGCPSAFVITSSVSTILGIARMARRGVVVKGGPPLDACPRVDTVLLDKTGTITLGEPRVKRVIPIDSVGDEALRIASALAMHSLHPVSRAIHRYAGGNGVSAEIYEVQEIPGKGLVARLVDGREALLGSREFLEEKGMEVPVDDASVFLAIGGRPVLGFVVEEVPREDAVEAIRELKRRGLRVVIVSGDREERVKKVAEKLGVNEYYAGVKPGDKRSLVEKLQGEGNTVAMVGDGINDAPALAQADLGVAMGRYALVAEVADAVIVSGELKRIVDLLETGRLRERVLRLGIGGAAVLKLSVMALGLAGVLPIWLIAALGDDGSTLLGLLPVALLARK